MATRFYFRESEIGSPPVNVTPDAGWTNQASPADKGPMHTATDGADALATITSFGGNANETRLMRQWVSEPMAAGNDFASATHKCYAQVFESNADDNLQAVFGARVVSEDGTTVRATLLAVDRHGGTAEFNTSLRNKSFADGDVGASYTTVAGDRLVVELGQIPVAGTTPSGAIRQGSDGATDLPENETDTDTSKNPWYETSVTIAFAGGAEGSAPYVGGGYYPVGG